jgi:hypothetical protein
MRPMHAVKNSARALITAAIPFAVLQAVTFAMLLLRTQTSPALLALPSPDKVLVLYIMRLAFDTGLLFTGHLMLRRCAISGRLAYALMGGAMAAASYAIVLRNGLLLASPDAGTVMTAGLLPTLAGMMAGFLYCQFAGLAPVEVWPKFSIEGLNASYKFDGPVRVRTSIAATAIAAVVPAILTALLTFAMYSTWLFTDLVPAGPAIFVTAIPAQMFLISLTVTIVPAAIFVLCTHHIARALHRQSGFDYAALGGLLGALCSTVIVPSMPFDPFASDIFPLVSAIICGAIMGALYRRFAGIEPVPLPEPVIVTDENTLVPADHSSRRGHSVMLVD